MIPVRALVSILGIASLWGSLAATADQKNPASSTDLVVVQKGTLPIIISAPHGGRAAVPGVPKRLGVGIKQFVTMRDQNTDLLAEAVARELEKKLGAKPWLVIARFDRAYIDANRSPERAYENAAAKSVYNAYHEPLIAACKAIKKKHGRGLLLDIHGQGVYPNSICRGTRNGKTVSLMVDRFGWPSLTGKNSVMGRLENSEYRVLPRCDSPRETKEEAKFSGGFTVNTYGSHTGYGIDAVQLEFGLQLRTRTAYPRTAKDLAEAVCAFHEAYLKDE